MANRALLRKSRAKAKRLNAMQKSREALHMRRLKLDILEQKARDRVRAIESKQAAIADRYNSLVYRIAEESNASPRS